LPLQTRNEIDELIEEFLDNVKMNIHDMRGLDSNRDTEEEVETAIRLFPKILGETKGIALNEIFDDYSDDTEDDYIDYFIPIQFLSFLRRGGRGGTMCNLEAVLFIPLLVRLAIELGVFGEQFRGGLLCRDESLDENFLQNSMRSDLTELHNREHYETIDNKYLQVLIQLRKMGVFKKEDIQNYDLMGSLCGDDGDFSYKRFQFLVEWDPSSLFHHLGIGRLPLHLVASKSSIRGFRSVFEAGIKYFPNKKGISLLFHKRDVGPTTFQLACNRFGYDKVMKIVEGTLIRYSDTPINITEALIMASIDENIHLDCVYFLLRREPDILHKLLVSTQTAVTATAIDSFTNEATRNNRDSEKRKRKIGT
jgi:hypothetical protein